MWLRRLWEHFLEVENRDELQELRKDLLAEISSVTIIFGWLLTVTAIAYRGELEGLFVALLLFASGLSCIWFRKKSSFLAFLALIGGVTAAISVHQTLFPDSLAYFFYPIVIIVSGLMVSTLSIFIIATIVSTICLGIALWNGAVFLDGKQVWTPILLIYITAFVSWLSSRQIRDVLGRVKTSYTEARDWLEQLRQERIAQLRTIKTLEEAYVRIERLNYQLVEARIAAESARRLKAEFAANISHELRTPLNLIIGFSETMANAPETYRGVTWSPVLRGDVDEIYRSSRHLSELIDDILDLSALEVRRLGLNLQETQIGPIVESAVSMMRELYRAKRLYLKVDIEADLPPVLIDETRIRQILINLLSNANRFTIQGGTTISIRRLQDSIQISVADTGVGIARQDIDKVFEEFGQVDSSMTRAHEGTGLGVPLSKRLVEMHGGNMWLESFPELGTTFYFTLPLRHSPSAVAHAANNDHVAANVTLARAAMRKSIFVAEADSLLLRTMRRHLSAYDLVEVSRAQDLAEEIKKHHPIALVMAQPLTKDHTHTDQSDWSDAVPPDLPVVWATLEGNLSVAEALGIEDYLLKPIAREQLLSAIERLAKDARHILVVDDDPELSDLFKRMIESAGDAYTVHQALQGKDALHMLHTRSIDLVLLDLFLPDISGMDVLRHIKQEPMLRAVPVIMISGQYPEELASSHPLSLHLQRAHHASLIEMLDYLRALLGALSAEAPYPESGSKFPINPDEKPVF
ncbi:MAG: ATP-binding protein [Chloroflexota bacterium]